MYSTLGRNPMNQTVNIKQRGLVFTRKPESSELASRTIRTYVLTRKSDVARGGVVGGEG